MKPPSPRATRGQMLQACVRWVSGQPYVIAGQPPGEVPGRELVAALPEGMIGGCGGGGSGGMKSEYWRTRHSVFARTKMPSSVVAPHSFVSPRCVPGTTWADGMEFRRYQATHHSPPAKAKPDSIPSEKSPSRGFRTWESCLDDAGWSARFYSCISRFSPPSHSGDAPYTHLASPAVKVESRRGWNEMIMEQHRNAKAGEMGDPRENPSSSGIVRHDIQSEGIQRYGGWLGWLRVKKGGGGLLNCEGSRKHVIIQQAGGSRIIVIRHAHQERREIRYVALFSVSRRGRPALQDLCQYQTVMKAYNNTEETIASAKGYDRTGDLQIAAWTGKRMAMCYWAAQQDAARDILTLLSVSVNYGRLCAVVQRPASRHGEPSSISGGSRSLVFACGNRAGRRGFSRRRSKSALAYPSSTLRASMLRAAQNSSSNVPNARMKGGGGGWDIPDETSRPAVSSSTIPICKNPGATPPGIEPGSPRWEASGWSDQRAEKILACCAEREVNRVSSVYAPRATRASREQCKLVTGYDVKYPIQTHSSIAVTPPPLLFMVFPPRIHIPNSPGLFHSQLARPAYLQCVHTVAERLAHSPLTKANRVQSPTASPDFRKWESCRTMPLVGGFSRGSTASPSSLLRAVQISLVVVLCTVTSVEATCGPGAMPAAERHLRLFAVGDGKCERGECGVGRKPEISRAPRRQL
ncbi:hypothetical protein PR048_032209 [Dryococelus australis]|uniref:Uncharacterized protein n=1 Tax=Dryococelus australis TaxID=614101 RepID=A0ABQ9G4E9_9NEOP|nr:hypothetical protein PR048_032209 [Dryococelus australis]